jgi:hypothetical protein
MHRTRKEVRIDLQDFQSDLKVKEYVRLGIVASVVSPASSEKPFVTLESALLWGHP